MILLIVCLAILNYRHLVIETNDEVPEMLAPVVRLTQDPELLFSSTLRIGLFDSASTRAFSRSVRSDYPGLLAQWRDFLQSQSLAVTLFQDMAEASQFDLVVLAETVCLSEEESLHVKNYLVRGGNVFMVGAVGSRDENGQWTDAHLFGDVVGMRFAGNANATPGRVTMTLNGNLPVAPDWTPRSQVTMQSFNPVLTGKMVENRSTVVATVPYADPSQPNVILPMPVLCYGHYLSGRFAWSGFSPEVTQSDVPSTSREAIRELFGNVVGWLTGAPKVRTDVWPQGKATAAAAVVLLSDPHSDEWERMLRSGITRFPVTLAVAWNALDGYEQRLRELGTHVDLAIAIDEHYLEEHRLRGRLTNLRMLARKIRTLSGHETIGLLVKNLPAHDFAAEAIHAGYRYILSEPVGDIEDYPEILMTRRTQGWLRQPEKIVLAPYRTSWIGGSSARSLTVVFDAARDSGNMRQFADWMEHNQQRIWQATVLEICQWRSSRNAVAMARQFLSGGRLRVRLTNGSYQDMHQFAFSVEFPEEYRDVDIWAKAIGLEVPYKTSEKDGRVWHFVIHQIQPGRTLEYVITPVR